MPDRNLRRDERAIEGLPIRLVIALVVGVASLGVMMNTISGLGSLGVSELDVQPEPEVIEVEETPTDIEVTVVDSEGKPVANATVIAKSGDAGLGGISTAETGYNGTATLSIDPTLGDNQAKGTVEFDVKPPSDAYDDRRENTAVLVVRE